ncbi:hypothetical protein ACFS07_06485 [Undibacterium arcticum]
MAINLSNRKASSRSTNKVLFGTNQTGHWNIPHAALNVGLERKKRSFFFYTNPNQGTELYVGKVASKVVTSKNAAPSAAGPIHGHCHEVLEESGPNRRYLF